MDSFRDAIDTIEARRQTIEVYTDEADIAAELETQFATRNVDVRRRAVPSPVDRGFLVVRNANDEFQGAIGIDHLQELLSPEIHPPWRLESATETVGDVFDFLDNTIFTAYGRRQLLAVAREIEERAWRTDSGTLYVGFQNSQAFLAQTSVYERFVRERSVTVRIFVDDDWDADTDVEFPVVSDASPEIGQFWFLVFDGGDLTASGLLAEERDPGRYYGFWTDDPDRVESLASYLESTYLDR